MSKLRIMLESDAEWAIDFVARHLMDYFEIDDYEGIGECFCCGQLSYKGHSPDCPGVAFLSRNGYTVLDNEDYSQQSREAANWKFVKVDEYAGGKLKEKK